MRLQGTGDWGVSEYERRSSESRREEFLNEFGEVTPIGNNIKINFNKTDWLLISFWTVISLIFSLIVVFAFLITR
jgi:hypothetical protein